MTTRIITLFFFFALLLSFGCGGGSGGSSPGSPSKATISFSLISTESLPYRIIGVKFSGTLPAGVTVTTNDASNPKLITDGLVPGSAVGTLADWQGGIQGRYSSPSRFMLAIADGTNTGFGPGEMVRLTCTVAAGLSLSTSDLQALENAITFRASVWDPTAATNPSLLDARLLKMKIAVAPSI